MTRDSKLIPHLEAAARHEDHLVLPPVELSASARRRAMTRLVRAGVAEEVQVHDHALGWREDGQASVGLRITDAGVAAVKRPTPAEPPTTKSPRKTKRASLVALMEREGGAGLGELIAVTGWQPHTVRAAITGLRKSGLTVETSRGDAGTVYRISPASAQAGEG
jgi:hypothetical protein